MHYSPGNFNFNILILIYVCFTSLKIVCPQGMFVIVGGNIQVSSFNHFFIINGNTSHSANQNSSGDRSSTRSGLYQTALKVNTWNIFFKAVKFASSVLS